jgi:hypothetical protein
MAGGITRITGGIKRVTGGNTRVTGGMFRAAGGMFPRKLKAFEVAGLKLKFPYLPFFRNKHAVFI